MSSCTNCGGAVPAGDRFCGTCGAAVKAAPAAAPAPIAGGPAPPNMHWMVVLILSWLTLTAWDLIWVVRQAAFVRKIDPGSRAIVLLVVMLLAMVGQVGLAGERGASSSESARAAIFGIMVFLSLAIVVVWLVAIFGMRKSIVRYYNTVEPIGLRLSWVMTLFFNILYFQYHFSRIVEWKKTGRLR